MAASTSVRPDAPADAVEDSLLGALLGAPRADLAPADVPRFSLLRVPRLPAAVRESRHRLLIAILALHVPAVLLLGVDHHEVRTSGLLALPLLAGVLGARFLRGRPLRSSAVTLGLAWSSYATVHLAGGEPGSHLQPLVVLALLALYQSPSLLALGLLGEVLSLAVPAAVAPGLVFAPGSQLDHPWTATLAAVVAMLGVAAAAALAWRRDVPVPVFAAPPGAVPDAETVATLERAREAELTFARKQTSYALMTSLARRNQSLIGRQLATLDDLERDERDPDVLSGLFALDHLATRMRRNAENLLVLAGAPASSRGFSQPVAVEELLRGAAAEVEQYARVDVSVGAVGAVAGHVVSDLAHLLAELLDNALACSPPTSQVTVGAVPGTSGGLRLWVADEGIGMTAARLREHNTRLHQDQDEPQVGATLGFPVVRRLAARHGIGVELAAREGDLSGLVAYVEVSAELVIHPAAAGTSGDGSGAVPAAAAEPLPTRTRAASPLVSESTESTESTALTALSAPPARSAPTALPGRRTARRPPTVTRRGRRNELAVDAKLEAADGPGEGLFSPQPLPPDTGTQPAVTTVWGDGLAQTPLLSAAVTAWTVDEVADRDTVVPAMAAPGRVPLVRRVPQQALLEAGGTLEVYEPGPEAPRPVEVDPVAAPLRTHDLLATYRAGLARARQAALDAVADRAQDAAPDVPPEAAPEAAPARSSDELSGAGA